MQNERALSSRTRELLSSSPWEERRESRDFWGIDRARRKDSKRKFEFVCVCVCVLFAFWSWWWCCCGYEGTRVKQGGESEGRRRKKTWQWVRCVWVSTRSSSSKQHCGKINASMVERRSISVAWLSISPSMYVCLFVCVVLAPRSSRLNPCLKNSLQATKKEWKESVASTHFAVFFSVSSTTTVEELLLWFFSFQTFLLVSALKESQKNYYYLQRRWFSRGAVRADKGACGGDCPAGATLSRPPQWRNPCHFHGVLAHGWPRVWAWSAWRDGCGAWPHYRPWLEVSTYQSAKMLSKFHSLLSSLLQNGFSRYCCLGYNLAVEIANCSFFHLWLWQGSVV